MPAGLNIFNRVEAQPLPGMMSEHKPTVSERSLRSVLCVNLFPMFKKWTEGYYAASLSFSHKQSVIDYIMAQQKHHENMRFDDEYDRLILKNGLTLYKYPE